MTLFAWLAAAVFVFANVGLILAVFLLAGGVHVVREMIAAAAEQRELARAEFEVVASRADEQQAQVLAGDVRGVYGEFPPETPNAAPVASGQR